MLIYLDNSILNPLKTPNIPHDILRSLEALSFILRSGNHLITGDRDTLTTITNLEDLSTPCKAIFRKAVARLGQTLSLFDHLSSYILVDHGRQEIDEQTLDNKTAIRIPIQEIINLELNQPTEILFEDISDLTIYNAVAQWYSSELLKSGNIPLRYRGSQGGGNRTFAVYQNKQQTANSLCLCITDSDKKFPTDSPGETSSKVRDINDTTKPLSHHLDLDFHEIENLLPISFLEALSGTEESRTIISHLKSADANGHPEAKLFWDYKKGVRTHFAKDHQDFRDYWCNATGLAYQPCETECTAKHCTCFMIRPWPLKSEVKEALSNVTNLAPSECDLLRDLWSGIGRVLISWTIGAPQQFT